MSFDNYLESGNGSCDIKLCSENEDTVMPPGIHIDDNLNFDYNVNKHCKKARIYKYMDARKRQTLMKVFITSQFSY